MGPAAAAGATGSRTAIAAPNPGSVLARIFWIRAAGRTRGRWLFAMVGVAPGSDGWRAGPRAGSIETLGQRGFSRAPGPGEAHAHDRLHHAKGRLRQIDARHRSCRRRHAGG